VGDPASLLRENRGGITNVHEWPADVVHAWRRLRAAPAFTLFSVLTLAIGIGATTAIYSAVYAAVLRPPDIREVGRVANIYHRDPRRAGSGPSVLLSRPDYDHYRAAQTSFEWLTAWKRVHLPLAANGSAELLMGEAVGGDYFSVVGVDPEVGRLIQPMDDAANAARVVVLSEALWRRWFAADPAVVGRTVKVAGETFEIVGVATAAFRGVDMPNVLPTAAWIPLSAVPVSDPGEVTDRERHTLSVKGRLKNGRSLDQAQAELRAIAQRLDLAYPIGTRLEPRFRTPASTSRPWFLMPAANVKMHESMDALVRPLVATIMIAMGLVLLVACTNVANLGLARGAARRHETAVRLALGASRWRLIRAQLFEAALLTLAGGVAAFAVARVLMAKILSGELRLFPGTSVQFAPEMNGSVALVALASTALALVVFGVIPAVHDSRGSVRQAMASDGQNAPLPRWRGRRGLIACQVAVSAGLVSVALLCAQQLIAIAQHDTGLDIDRLALVRVNLAMQRRDEAYSRRTLEQMLDAARRLPGVESAALSSGFPIEIGSRGGAVGVNSDELSRGLYNFMVSTPAVFATWGVRILQGRGFDERDTATSEPVVVVTERLARSLFPRGSAIGRQIVLRWQRFSGEPAVPIQTVTVIGVAADTDAGMAGNRGGGLPYLPWAQHYQSVMAISVRTAGDPAALVEPLKRMVHRVEPELPILDAETASALGGGRTLVLKVGAAAAGLLGWLALVLSMAGLYGVLTELVLRRTRELGIRMALGADAGRLLRMVLLDGTRPVLAGLAVGLGCGVVMRFAFRPLFIRMLPAFDPLTVALVPIAFLLAALLAAYLPARRAAAVEPNEALRHL
jgi:putative ABC transport system permease protein